MMHLRAHMRNAIFDLLDGNQKLDGVTIYKNRVRPIGVSEGSSALEVIVTREVSAPQGNHSGTIEYTRTIDFQIIGYSSGLEKDELSDQSDALALSVEEILHSDLTLSGLALEGWLESTDMVLDQNAYANASFAQTWKFISALSHAEISAL